jgi:hypothetical protein
MGVAPVPAAVDEPMTAIIRLVLWAAAPTEHVNKTANVNRYLFIREEFRS